MSTRTSRHDDPLSRYPDGAFLTGSATPVPLVATRFQVTLEGYVAAVETWRTFRNNEARTIEVTLSMPMPVRAALYALDATINGRTLKGLCQPRQTARQTYESAVDDGRLAVLHEEVLRGIHQLSVAHLPPGAEVTVRTCWAAFLIPNGPDRAMLRIPLTVGDVYGRSPLNASERLVSGGPGGLAQLTLVRAAEDVVWLGETRPAAGTVEVPLDRPIDLSVRRTGASIATARAADGRSIQLTIKPEPEADQNIGVAILVDRSGSMAERSMADAASPSKHAAAIAGLRLASEMVRATDRLDVFEFNQSCRAVGHAKGPQQFAEVLGGLGGPDGGTEISHALQDVLERTELSDVLVITDGKSYALDPMALARSGRRFSVVLIGEDSLEAGIGHLAALTGGALVVPRGLDVASAIGSVFQTLRTPRDLTDQIEGPLTGLVSHRDGLEIMALWRSQADADLPHSEAVRALATTVALTHLPEAEATALSVTEGLVGPLTSLVLVDQDGARQVGLPAVRKIVLPAPATASSRAAMVGHAQSYDGGESIIMARMAPPSLTTFDRVSHRLANAMSRLGDKVSRGRTKGDTASVHDATVEIWPRLPTEVWDREADRLVAGDLSGLPPTLAAGVRSTAGLPSVAQTAQALSLSPVLLVLGALARRDAALCRGAERVARHIFAAVDPVALAHALAALPA